MRPLWSAGYLGKAATVRLIMDELVLPKFEITEVGDDLRLSPEKYARWVTENWVRLRDNGQLDGLLNRPERCPVNARFTLSPQTSA